MMSCVMSVSGAPSSYATFDPHRNVRKCNDAAISGFFLNHEAARI